MIPFVDFKVTFVSLKLTSRFLFRRALPKFFSCCNFLNFSQIMDLLMTLKLNDGRHASPTSDHFLILLFHR